MGDSDHGNTYTYAASTTCPSLSAASVCGERDDLVDRPRAMRVCAILLLPDRRM